jgi:hypothetical protein
VPGEAFACPSCGVAVLGKTGLPVKGKGHAKRRRGSAPTPAADRCVQLRVKTTTATLVVAGLVALVALAFLLGMLTVRP